MKTILIILTILFCASAKGQFSLYKGTWVSSTREIIVIKDTTIKNNKLSNNQSIDFLFSLTIQTDTLNFISEYNDYRGRNSDSYTFKVLSCNDSILIVQPLSSFAKEYFKNKTQLKLIKQEYLIDNTINFEKIIFHSSSCFGVCPLIDLEINNKKDIYIKSDIVDQVTFRLDSLHTGYFTGQLTDSLYDELIDLLKTCNVETLKFRSIDGNDAPVVTLIIYYNGKRKYLTTMFPPIITDKLISFLNTIVYRAILTRTKENKKLEE